MAADLHVQARHVAGDILDHLKIKPTNYVTAVLWHDFSTETKRPDRESFMFIKGGGRISVAKIKQQYILHNGDNLEDIDLVISDKAISPESRMAELDYFEDRLVVFRARLPTHRGNVNGKATNHAPATNNGPHVASGTPSPFHPPTRQSSHSSYASAGAPVYHHQSPRPSIEAPGNPNHPYHPSGSRPSFGSSQFIAAPPAVPKPYSHVTVPKRYTPVTGSPHVGSSPSSTAPHPQHRQHVQNGYNYSPYSPNTEHAHPGSFHLKGSPASSPHPRFGRGPGLNPYREQQDQSDIKPEINTKAELPPPLASQPYIKPDPMGNATSAEQVAHEDDHDFEPEPSATAYLQNLAKETSVEKLEAGVHKGVHFLDQLKGKLQPGANSDDAQQWIKQIETVREEANRARTVVGVVGNTGAGKSSVINAILDEERLVPTNCMRACTAVVTEMSYNDSDDENSKYRAEIEFIKPEEWEKELKVLFDEVVDSSGNISREVYNADSEAGVAYAKMRAVYWKHTKEDLAASSIEKLMRDQSVRSLLGTTKHVKERYCDSFYKTLQHYVDSKEKSETTKSKSTDDDEKKKRKREQEFWPLIKVVRLYVKADALSTGAVLVDLPGVADSNAARAAVAEGYMKKCTGLWIVSPINRAVDDKAAKNLLGSSFRRQLKYDGTYSAVTFICSKTDDISNTEAVDSLGLGDEVGELDDQIDNIERKAKEVKKQISELKDKKLSLRQTMDDCDDEMEKWDEIREKADEGETVYAPVPKTKKRKRSPGSDSEDSDGDNETGQSQGASQSQSQSSLERGPAVSLEDIDTKIQELKDKKKEARRERTEVEAQIKEQNSRVKEFNAEAEVIEAKRSQICIAARNQYSKSAIQVDFAAGIKELDQEAAAEENPDDFNPEEDLRDYEQVARSLPVFCVSSRAYQKLSDRLQKDHAIRGFTDIEQTEIPALQEHCKKLTEGVRAVGCRRFLNALSQLRNSLSLWASNDGTGVKMTSQQKDAEQRLLSRKLKELEKALEESVKDLLADMKDALTENVFENYGTALQHASDAALLTAEGWGAHKNDGGLYWATYKATVRRQGVYAGASGPRDFNAHLTEPLYKHLASGWEKAFQRRLPHILKSCAKVFSKHLRAFHKAVEAHSRASGGNPRLGLLAQQLTAYEHVFTDLAGKMVDFMNESQREINREFTPSVCDAMTPAYDVCTAESGPGSFKRMKQHMSNHVTDQREHMFQSAAQTVRQKLNTMCKGVEEKMADNTDAVFVGMRRDYLQVLSNVRLDDSKMMPRWERNMRGEIEDLIKNSEDGFQAVLEGRLEVPKDILPDAEGKEKENVKKEEKDGAENEEKEDVLAKDNDGSANEEDINKNAESAEGSKKDTPADSEEAQSGAEDKDLEMTDADDVV